MKKKLFGSIAVLAIVTVASWNVGVNLNSQKNELSDLLLENVEALATGEGSRGIECKGYGSIECPLGGTCHELRIWG